MHHLQLHARRPTLAKQLKEFIASSKAIMRITATPSATSLTATYRGNELLPKRYGIRLHVGDTLLVFVKTSNLSIEDGQVRLFSDNVVKDFSAHGIEVFNLLLSLLLFEVLTCLHLFNEKVPHIGARVEEFLEGGLQVLFPKESDVSVLAEVLC